jgi:hypothetical protein
MVTSSFSMKIRLYDNQRNAAIQVVSYNKRAEAWSRRNESVQAMRDTLIDTVFIGTEM